MNWVQIIAYSLFLSFFAHDTYVSEGQISAALIVGSHHVRVTMPFEASLVDSAPVRQLLEERQAVI